MQPSEVVVRKQNLGECGRHGQKTGEKRAQGGPLKRHGCRVFAEWRRMRILLYISTFWTNKGGVAGPETDENIAAGLGATTTLTRPKCCAGAGEAGAERGRGSTGGRPLSFALNLRILLFVHQTETPGRQPRRRRCQPTCAHRSGRTRRLLNRLGFVPK